MVEAVKKIKLEPVPVGEVRVRKPAEYDLEIYAGEKRIGRAGETLTLPEGKHALTFRNDKLFVKETAQVSVERRQDATPVINFPVLGTLTVQAQPSNCKVFVDGVFVDVTPVLEAPIAPAATAQGHLRPERRGAGCGGGRVGRQELTRDGEI